MSTPDDEPQFPRFQLPEEFLRSVAAFSATVAAQIASSDAMAAVSAQAASSWLPQLQRLAEQAARDMAPFRDQLLRSALAAQAAGSAVSRGGAAVTDDVGLVDAVVVTVTAGEAKTSLVGADDADSGDIAEDMYRLMSVISVQLDEIAAGRPATPIEIYNAVTQTLALLVALIALIGPLVY